MIYYRPVLRVCAISRIVLMSGRIRLFCSHMKRNMARVLIRKVDSEERMQISLSYSLAPESLRPRQFNFDRLQSEEVEKTLARIQGNISRSISEKNKKKKKKQKLTEGTNELSPDDLTVKVSLLDSCRRIIDGKTTNDVAWTTASTLSIDEVDYCIVLNAPTLKKLTLPSCILVRFSIQPVVCAEFADLKQSKFIWYREQKLPNDDRDTDSRRNSQGVADWKEIHTGHSYTPDDSDEGLRLKIKCIPCNGTEEGEPMEAVSKSEVQQGPKQCPFENRHQYTQDYTTDDCIRVVTYNILADVYADSDFTRDYLFPYCPTYALDISYRKHLLKKEITGYKADIICLQEVDQKVFVKDLKPSLELQGYEGHLNLKANNVLEGTATFFRTSKFRLLSQHNVTLVDILKSESMFKELLQKVTSSESLNKAVLERTTSLQVSVLEYIHDPSKLLLVATTHLYFHPRASNIRILQTYLSLRHVESVLAEYEDKRQQRPSVIFCGDFNSYPEGGVHQLLKSKYIPAHHADWYSAGKEQFVEGIELTHGVSLKSACGYPRYTNYVAGFSGCLDYIYIEETKLETVSIVPMPTHEEVTQYTAIPNIVFPSDHIALVCDLRWLD